VGAEIRVRGFAYERELAYRLWKAGFAVMRAPASGAKVKRYVYPDVLAVRDRRVLVFEVKARREYKSICVEGYKISRLLEFARRAGGEAYVAVKITSAGRWAFVPASSVRRTDRGFYCISKSELEAAPGLDELLKSPASG